MNSAHPFDPERSCCVFDADAPCHSTEAIETQRRARADTSRMENLRHALSWLERSMPRGVELVAAALAGIEPGECPALSEILAHKIKAGGTDLCPVCRKRLSAPGVAHGWCIECSADESSKSPAERVRDRVRKEAHLYRLRQPNPDGSSTCECGSDATQHLCPVARLNGIGR